ncbi:hypothetical protein BaOVIS_028190 [Babesia ovis]|uniref:DNA-(apurinic or apyrimidinic site) lyase n=1 Tax=Babesia ovis TaxID=5869 RepID=A0A9W5TD95_BABOV|nr:hypothetical protein BaOVIS_028190 [Babesia ovis]
MLSAQIMNFGRGMEQRSGSAPQLRRLPELQELCYLRSLNTMASPLRSYGSMNGTRLPSLENDGEMWAQWWEQMRQTPLPTETLSPMNQPPMFPNEEDIVPMELLVEYAQYHDRVSAQHQKHFEIQNQLQQMHAQYAQYQAFLTAFHLPQLMEMDAQDDQQQSTQNSPSIMGSSPTHLASPDNGYNNADGTIFIQESPRELPYAFLSHGATAPCSPDRNSPAMSSETTPNNVEGRCGLSALDGTPESYHKAPMGEVEGVDMVTKPVVTLCSMASVSTVDLMNDDGYRTMATGVSLEDADNTFEITRKRTLSIDEPVESELPAANEGKRQKLMDTPGLDFVQDPYYLNNPSPPPPCYNGAGFPSFTNNWPLGYHYATPFMGVQNGRYPFLGFHPFLGEPIINGQINHDYYRRDFYSKISEQGFDHLFAEPNILWNPINMGCIPLFNGSTGIMSCGNGVTENQAQPPTHLGTLGGANVLRTPSSNIQDQGPTNLEMNYSEDSDEEDNYIHQCSRNTHFGRKFKDSRDIRKKNGSRGKIRVTRSDGEKPINESNRSSLSKADKIIELNREHMEMAEALKSLEVGGLMIINKRRSHKEAQMEIRKATKCYDYLLDIPLIAEPDPELGAQQYKCLVPGVYWDKRSWIASWYDQGNRCYSSFSAKMHGFYKAKYFAIHVRMFKTNNLKSLDQAAVELDRQSFSWSPVGSELWVGVIDSAVVEVRKVDDCVEFRTLFGKCEESRLRSYFDLDHEYKLDRVRAPPSVTRVVDQLEGVRILQQEPLETLVSFICSANNNIKRITRLCFAIRERYGTFLGSKDYPGSQLRFYSFPTLRQLSTASSTELRALGLGYRAEYLAKTISALREGGIDVLLSLREVPYPAAQLELLKFHGVGRKVADCVLLFGLGKREVVPVDVHVKRIAMNHFGIRNGANTSYEAIQDAFTQLCPKDAGWLQAVLFIDSVIRGSRQVTKVVT